MQSEQENELDVQPVFEIGDLVKLTKTIRNDGTLPGVPVGQILLKPGEEGYIVNIGTFLQKFYIYGVHYVAKNMIVGCRKHELNMVREAFMRVMLRNNCEGHLMAYVPKKDLEEPVIEQTSGEHGQIFTLANGWQLELAEDDQPLSLPATVEMRRLA